MTHGNRRSTCALLVALVWTFSVPPLAVRADVQEAVQRALPATIAVERRASGSKTAGDGETAEQPLPERRADDADPAGALPLPPAAAENAPPLTQPPKSSPPALPLSRAHTVELFSGVIISADGLIVTVAGPGKPSGQYTATLIDGRRFPARVVAIDRRTQLQLLKVDATDLPFLEASDEEPQVGQTVASTWARGPLDRTASRGIIAARDRTVEGFGGGLLQTDLLIGASAAGAPLLDQTGRLLGVIVAKQARDIELPGPVFAVPAAAVRPLLEVRPSDQPVIIQPGFLGVSLQGQASVIGSVLPDTSAAAAGLRRGDRIAAIDGRMVDSTKEVLREVRHHRAGETVTVTVLRGGERYKAEVTLEALPEHLEPSSSASDRPRPTAAPVTVRVLPRAAEQEPPAIPPLANPSSEVGPYGAAHHVAPPPVMTPTIRVERSDVERRLDQLTRQIEQLQQQNQKLLEQMEQLNARLKEDQSQP